MARARPWQNRASLISCWEHSTVGTDLTGEEVNLLQLSMDNIILAQLPTCIPRACRLTRVCVHYRYFSNPGLPFTLRFRHSRDCENDGYSEDDIEIPIGVGNFAANCFCGELSVILPECSIWQADIGTNGTVFPLFRVIWHFELQ